MTHRIFTLDVLRSLGIIMMVIFHFIYDLKFFGYVSWDTPDGAGWRSFRHLILGTFFICLGASLHSSYQTGINWKKFTTRLCQILSAALAVSLASLVMVPNHYIYFGVLQFVGLACLACVGFAQRPRLALVIGLGIVISYQVGWVSAIWPFNYIQAYLPTSSNDYVSLFPWLGVVFMAIWLASTSFWQNDPLQQFKQYSFLAWPGKHSLVIYLVHQPVLFAMFGLITLF